jgi:hypothetical protein
MLLSLSSAAAPDASISELRAACVHRGLAGVELCLAAGATDLVEEMVNTRDADPPIVGLWTDASLYAHELSAVSRASAAPIVLGGPRSLEERMAFTRSIIAHGGDAMVLVTGAAESWLPAITAMGLPFAWQVDKDSHDAAGDAQRIQESGAPLAYVRLIGGGPETAQQEGRGFGALMMKLTLAAYGGPLVMVPSSPRYRVAWRTWLGRRGGSGCGSKVAQDDRMIPIHK